jgi:hypothetical protein
MRIEGLEPPRAYAQLILSQSRLPIPPYPQRSTKRGECRVGPCHEVRLSRRSTIQKQKRSVRYPPTMYVTKNAATNARSGLIRRLSTGPGLPRELRQCPTRCGASRRSLLLGQPRIATVLRLSAAVRSRAAGLRPRVSIRRSRPTDGCRGRSGHR